MLSHFTLDQRTRWESSVNFDTRILTLSFTSTLGLSPKDQSSRRLHSFSARYVDQRRESLLQFFLEVFSFMTLESLGAIVF